MTRPYSRRSGAKACFRFPCHASSAEETLRRTGLASTLAWSVSPTNTRKSKRPCIYTTRPRLDNIKKDHKERKPKSSDIYRPRDRKGKRQSVEGGPESKNRAKTGYPPASPLSTGNGFYPQGPAIVALRIFFPEVQGFWETSANAGFHNAQSRLRPIDHRPGT